MSESTNPSQEVLEGAISHLDRQIEWSIERAKELNRELGRVNAWIKSSQAIRADLREQAKGSQ